MIDKINKAGREVVEADLIKDQDFIESAKKVWQMDNGISKQFQGSDQEAVQYGLDRMAKFNYNISLGTVPDMIHIGSQDMDTKIAFAYLMDTYDDKDITWAGVGRFVKETGTDITNYITLGGGGAVSQVAKIPAKEALKKTIMSQITKHLAKPIVQSVPVGAGYAGGFNVAQQKVRKEAGLQKGISGKEAAVSAAVGAVVAPVAVKGVQVVGKGIKKAGQLAGKGIDYINREGEEAMAQAAGGGTPPMGTDNTVPLYHGTNAEFDKFDRVGSRITSLGYGHYFSPDKNTAIEYGKNIKKININKDLILDLDNPTKDQKKRIVEQLNKVVPDNIKSGYGEIQRIDITDMDRSESLALFKQKKEDTKDAWHDRAKAQVIEEGDKIYIQWQDQGLENATNANIKNLIQEYGQNIPKDIGFKAAKSGNEVAIYDTELVNKSLQKDAK